MIVRIAMIAIGLCALARPHGASAALPPAPPTVWAIYLCDFGGMTCSRLAGDYPTQEACLAALLQIPQARRPTMICQRPRDMTVVPPRGGP